MLKFRPILSVLLFFVASSLSAQTLVHRYEFNGNVNDSVGSQNGTATVAGTNLEAPNFVAFTPTGATGPTQSIEFGMNVGTLKSGFTLGQTVIDNQAAAGSVSMFAYMDSVTSGGAAYLFAALAAADGFTIVQANATTNLTNRLLNDTGTDRSSSGIGTGEWVHVAYTWEKSGANVTGNYYINGSVVGSAQSSAGTIDTVESRIGTFNFSDTTTNVDNQFDGHLYDLQIYNGVLSSSQVSSLSSGAGTAIPEPGAYGLLIGLVGLSFVCLKRRRA